MHNVDTVFIDALADERESNNHFIGVSDDFTSVPYHDIEVDDFPLEIFPARVRRFVEETADSIPCPRDFAALPILAVVGGLIGNKRVIEAKVGYRQYAQGWYAVIGAPGSGKTEPLKKAMQPVMDLQTKYWDVYQQNKEKYDIELANWKDDKKNNQEPIEPKMQKAYVSDSTFEALVMTLQENPNLIAYWDEASGWIKSMNQYRSGAGADKAHYLSMWSFAPVNITRMTRTNYIPDPHLAIVGGIQPDVLASLQSEMSEADGFIHRILFAYPKRRKRSRSDVELSEVAENAWKMVCERLLDLKQSDDDNPVVMKMTEAAKAQYNAWQDDHFQEVNAPDFPERMEGVWSKLEVYMLRLALTVHMLRVVSDEARDGEIDEKSVLAAAELIDYFKSHAKKVYECLTETAEDKRVRVAIEWLRKREGETASQREFQMSHVAGIKKASEAKTLIEAIAGRGHGIVSFSERKSLRITLVENSNLPLATLQQMQH